MRAYDVIRKKRDGGKLSSKEVEFIVKGSSSGEVPDYQLSAFLMAVYHKGMDMEETVALTEAMMNSGTILDLSSISGTKVDKHSTGGVGDKVSIILAPLAAAMGLKVPMVSGRGLGHTGGTLDKLESIPGFRTDLTLDEFRENIKRIGIAIMGQTDEMAPADRKFYALRDVTATVESIPLIAASIMSKKLAEGIDGLVLDVKCGAGAFMKTREQARELGRALVDIGTRMGKRCVAVLTDMEQPLGKTVGNSLEIKESLTALKGRGAQDLMNVTLTLATWMLHIADCVGDEVPLKKLGTDTMRRYRDEVVDYIEKGDAFKKFAEFVDAQHGDPDAPFVPRVLPVASIAEPLAAPNSGFIVALDAEAVGTASMLLGAGRKRAEDTIDHAAGIILNKKVGDNVDKGEPLAMFHTSDASLIADAQEVFLSGLHIGKEEPAVRPLVIETVMP